MAKTQEVNKTEKRAIPLGLIFSGVSAIGGLIIKGFNTISNYRKSKAMAKAMKQLYHAQEIDHRRLQRLEHHTSLLAKATKTAFAHIDGKLAVLDVKIGNVIDNLKAFMTENDMAVQVYLAGDSSKPTRNQIIIQRISNL